MQYLDRSDSDMDSIDFQQECIDILRGQNVDREDDADRDKSVPSSSQAGDSVAEDLEEEVAVEEKEHQSARRKAEMQEAKKAKRAKQKENRKLKDARELRAEEESTETAESLLQTSLPAVALQSSSSALPFRDVPKPNIIGLYGISGCGKSYLVDKLKAELAHQFDFYDGSAVLNEVMAYVGGLQALKEMRPNVQNAWRTKAIERIVETSRRTGKPALVTGHFTLWDEGGIPYNIDTKADWEAYTHIIYLHVDPMVVKQRRSGDVSKTRRDDSVKHLEQWQAQERYELRDLCYQKRVLFTTIVERESTSKGHVIERLKMLLSDFQHSNEKTNLAAIDTALDFVISRPKDKLETMLVLDADKTLGPQDAGSLLWRCTSTRQRMPESPLRRIFKLQNYSYASFHQATLLYEELSDDFDYMCMLVAVRITLYPEMAALLAQVARKPHIGAVVVTCGLRRVWELVLRISGLTHVQVIGCGRVRNGYIVTDKVKGQIVDKLKDKDMRVVAFGDSIVDEAMLTKADDAYVIVGGRATRSKSMEDTLLSMVKKGFSGRQILFPPTGQPRLDTQRLPVVKLDEAQLRKILKPRCIHATQKASAKLLMTATRNDHVWGHDLRKAHEEVGYYLANEFLGEILGLDTYPIPHVTGSSTDGYRICDEGKTLIIPLMRGGEPMAFGVSKALKLATFVHSHTFSDINEGHFDGKKTIILVDSVVNSGKSIMEYLEPLRKRDPQVKVVVVAGVVQAQAMHSGEDGSFGQSLRKDSNLTLVALRKSENKYTGKGTTDTGHRLFNTTYMD